MYDQKGIASDFKDMDWVNILSGLFENKAAAHIFIGIDPIHLLLNDFGILWKNIDSISITVSLPDICGSSARDNNFYLLTKHSLEHSFQANALRDE